MWEFVKCSLSGLYCALYLGLTGKAWGNTSKSFNDDRFLIFIQLYGSAIGIPC